MSITSSAAAAVWFHAACERDLEGIVAKWAKGPYHTDGVQTSWIKIKNPTYSHMTGRRELFERRDDRRQGGQRPPPPILCLR
jgi:ATP-dependent DNA ligase